MGLEVFTGKVSDLVATNPPGTDPKSQGDDHLRGIKTTIIGQSVNMQIGQNSDPAHNFSTSTNDDGTMRLGRGNASAISQDIMTVDAAGKVAFPQNTLVGFIATQTTIGLATSGVLPTGTERRDDGNCFDTGTYKFQPSIAGWYSISACSIFNIGAMQYAGLSIVKNALESLAVQLQPPYATTFAQVSCAAEVYMNGSSDYCILNYVAAPTGGTATDVRFSATLTQRA